MASNPTTHLVTTSTPPLLPPTSPTPATMQHLPSATPQLTASTPYPDLKEDSEVIQVKAEEKSGPRDETAPKRMLDRLTKSLKVYEHPKLYILHP